MSLFCWTKTSPGGGVARVSSFSMRFLCDLDYALIDGAFLDDFISSRSYYYACAFNLFN